MIPSRLIPAVMAVFLCLTPAHAQEAVIAFVCHERGHAEALAGEMTEHNVMQRDPRWMTCAPFGQAIASMDDAPTPLMGPLADWEGDPFALYAVQDVFLIVYWVNGYKPTGISL